MMPARLHVRTLDLTSLPLPRHVALAARLDAAERDRAGRFAVPAARREYEAAHGLLRETVAELTGVEGFACVPPHPQGKPALLPPPAVPCDINISHASGCVACAVALGGVAEVGIDVEWLGRRADPAIAERFFAADETDWLGGREEALRKESFLAIWTLKEAFVKALGLGVAFGLASFSVRPDPPRLLTAPPAAGPLSAWRLWQWRPTPQHLAALAVRLPDGAPEPLLDLRAGP